MKYRDIKDCPVGYFRLRKGAHLKYGDGKSLDKNEHKNIIQYCFQDCCVTIGKTIDSDIWFIRKI